MCVGSTLLFGCKTIERRDQLLDEVEPTLALLVSADETCQKLRDNEALMAKKCFPRVTGKPLLVRVTAVDPLYGLTIQASPDGAPATLIECYPPKALENKILERPEVIKVGFRYLMKGRMTLWEPGPKIRLEGCKLKKWSSPPRKAAKD